MRPRSTAAIPRVARLAGAVALCALLLGAPPASAEGWPFDLGLGDDNAKSTPAPTSAVRVFKLGGVAREADTPWTLLGVGGDRLNFPRLVQRIRDEAASPSVKALVFRFGQVDLGMAQLQTLQREIAAARAAGKRVVAHAEMGMNAQLVALTAADEVHLTPEGTVYLTGLRAEVAYYQPLLQTIGVEADIEAVGRYKSAAEPMTRATMSDAAREALDALLDSVFSAFVDALATNRGLKRDAARALVDAGLLSADEAKRRGLVDTLSYWPELLTALEKRFKGAPTLAWPIVEDAPDLSSIFSLLDLFTSSETPAAPDRSRVALLVAEGPIVSGSHSGGLFNDDAVIAADDFLKALRAAEADTHVRAIVVRINSPGGSALASDLIWRALERAGKTRPVVASMGNVAASGGYYIASAAKRIYAEASTLTGSIGVFGGKLVWRDLMDKIGVHTEVLTRGAHAGLFSPMDRFSDSERAAVRANMMHTYKTFVNRVARGRSMSFDAVDAVAQGRVWSGAQALDVGLVDTLGGLSEAIAGAAKLARLKPGSFDIARYPKGRSFLELLAADPTVLRAPELKLSDLGRALPAPLAQRATGIARILEQLLARELTLAMQPFAITIR